MIDVGSTKRVLLVRRKIKRVSKRENKRKFWQELEIRRKKREFVVSNKEMSEMNKSSNV